MAVVFVEDYVNIRAAQPFSSESPLVSDVGYWRSDDGHDRP